MRDPLVRAWCYLVAALLLHVIDEAATGFLRFYNPLVLSIRAQVRWFPMPTLTFGVWLGGLLLLVALLAMLTGYVSRRGRGTSILAFLLSAIMLLNGLGHLGGSLYWRRWLPGTTSAPLLVIASLLLAARVLRPASPNASR